MTQTLRENKDNLPPDPYDLFQTWMSEAEKAEINNPNAMALATANKDGQPSVRMILLKGIDERGFVFYTNADSNKGQQLAENGKAALCFYWKSLGKQVRVEGPVEGVSDEEADAYFASRHRSSRIGAWASKQSRPLNSYDELEKLVGEYEEKFEGQDDIPRPDYWNGYRVKPNFIEFWIEGEHRLHRRYRYELEGQNWVIKMLYP